MRIIAMAVLILMTLGLGTPTFRMNYGKRKIDYYRNGLMFEGDNVVGVSKR